MLLLLVRWPRVAPLPPATGPHAAQWGQAPGNGARVVIAARDVRARAIGDQRQLLQAARDIGTGYSNTIPAYIFVAIIFILINYSLTVVAGRVERRLSRRVTLE